MALGDAADSGIDVLVSLKNPDAFDEIQLDYAVHGAPARSADLIDYTTHTGNPQVREYKIPLACGDSCTLDVHAWAGTGTAGGRFALTPRNEGSSFVTYALIVIGLLTLVQAGHIYHQTRRVYENPAHAQPAHR